MGAVIIDRYAIIAFPITIPFLKYQTTLENVKNKNNVQLRVKLIRVTCSKGA